ncbi:MAG: hypothetical protein AB1758_33100, partial [Candidatus Eremiobacterota bacterium]
LRPCEELDSAVDLFEQLFLDEKDVKRSVDPTGPARRAFELIDERLEADEAREAAVAAYRRLWRHSCHNHLFETPGESVDYTVRKRYALIDECRLPREDRLQAVEQFLADPRGFEARKLEERIQATRTDLRMGERDGYLVVGSSRLPIRCHGRPKPSGGQ